MICFDVFLFLMLRVKMSTIYELFLCLNYSFSFAIYKHPGTLWQNVWLILDGPASAAMSQDTNSDDICLKWHLIKCLSRCLTNLCRSLSFALLGRENSCNVCVLVCKRD